MKRTVIQSVCALAIAGGVLFGMALGISGAVCHKTRDRIYDLQDVDEIDRKNTYDCVLVLGCRVYDDGRLSPMLEDRMKVAVDLMEQEISDRLLVSGDHATDDYDEVGAMKNYAIENGVDSSAVFQDHDGYSTYDSIARLKTVYGARRVVIVTQSYHLHRALHLAQTMGIEAVGVSADLQSYSKQASYDFREIFARCKDVYLGLRAPEPSGELIPVSLKGDGDATACGRPAQ